MGINKRRAEVGGCFENLAAVEDHALAASETEDLADAADSNRPLRPSATDVSESDGLGRVRMRHTPIGCLHTPLFGPLQA